MIKPSQVATIIAGAILSARLFLLGLDPATAGPVAASSVAATPPPAAAEPAAVPNMRAYLFRGALGPIFSRGMDHLAEEIENAGIPRPSSQPQGPYPPAGGWLLKDLARRHDAPPPGVNPLHPRGRGDDVEPLDIVIQLGRHPPIVRKNQRSTPISKELRAEVERELGRGTGIQKVAKLTGLIPNREMLEKMEKDGG